MSIFRKIISGFSQLLNNSAFMAIIGVVVGGLITGIFNYKAQQTLITSQRQQFRDTYLIEKNNQLKKDISGFSDLLSKLITVKSSMSKDSIFSSLFSTSLRITLLEDYNIGNKCWGLTASLKESFDSLKLKDNNLQSKITDWIVAVKLEMKTVDYSIDENAVEKDLLQFILNTPEKK